MQQAPLYRSPILRFTFLPDIILHYIIVFYCWPYYATTIGEPYWMNAVSFCPYGLCSHLPKPFHIFFPSSGGWYSYCININERFSLDGFNFFFINVCVCVCWKLTRDGPNGGWRYKLMDAIAEVESRIFPRTRNNQEEHQREKPSPRLGGSLRRPRRKRSRLF